MLCGLSYSWEQLFFYSCWSSILVMMEVAHVGITIGTKIIIEPKMLLFDAYMWAL